MGSTAYHLVRPGRYRLCLSDFSFFLVNVKSLNHILTIEEGHYLIMSCCRSSVCGWQEAVMSVWRTVRTSRGDLGDKCWKPLTKLRFLSPILEICNGALFQSKWIFMVKMVRSLTEIMAWLHPNFSVLMLQEQWCLGCRYVQCLCEGGHWQADCFRYKTVDLFPSWSQLNSHHQ